MEFKQGHYYKMRGGERSQYIGKTDFNEEQPHIFVHLNDGNAYMYTEAGTFISTDTDSNYDIVEELPQAG